MDLTRVRSAVRKGMNTLRPPEAQDEDLNFYRQLQPSDFKDIIDKFGVDPTLEYIRTMEVKIKAGTNG